MQDKIEQDLKTAMLAGDKIRVGVLKSLKNALAYEVISLNARDTGLNDEQIQKVLARESKKRAEAVDLYAKAGETERVNAELAEKAIIDDYLPQQLDETTIKSVVLEEIAKLESPSPTEMGRIIGAVRARLGASADGATIARLVKEQLGQK